MAKRKGINVSEAIRTYLNEHKDEGPTAAAEAISKQIGKKISPTYVSNIKAMMKKKGGGKKRGQKPGARKQLASGVAANGSVDLITLEAVKRIIRHVGAEKAKRLIDILA